MGINLIGNCLDECIGIVQDFGTIKPESTMAIKNGLQDISSSMVQIRKELVKNQEKKKKSLERRNTDGRY